MKIDILKSVVCMLIFILYSAGVFSETITDDAEIIVLETPETNDDLDLADDITADDLVGEIGEPPFRTPLLLEDTDTGNFFEGNDELQAYLLEAADNHPALKMWHESWHAALSRIPQVTSLEDPMFSYTQFLRSDMNKFSLMLGQQFPWFGTLALRGEQAAAEAEALRMQMFATRDEIFWQVKDAYYQLAYLADQLAVVEAQLELINFTEEVIRVRYGLGIAMQDELLRIQMEQSRTIDMRQEILQRRAPVSASLNAALGRPLDDDITWPVPSVAPPESPEAADLATFIRDRNPVVLARESMRQEGEKGVALAQRKAYPNITLQMEYMVGRNEGRMWGDPWMPGRVMAYRGIANTAMGTMPFNPVDSALDLYDAFYQEPMGRNRDEFAVSLSVNVPVWRKRIRGEVEEARHRVRAIEFEQHVMAREIEREAHMMLFEMEDAKRRLALYQDDLVPKAQQTFESLLSAYAGGGYWGGFVDVLDSINRLLDFELEQVRASRDWYLAATRLEYLLAGPWEESNEEPDSIEETATDF